MNRHDRGALAIVLDLLIIVMFALSLGGVGFQIYAFNQYRADVQGNRALLCEAPSLVNERYCRDLRQGAMRTGD
jgi:hypothetical protein